MHIGHWESLAAFIWPAIMIAGLVTIGAVFAKRAGAGSGRLWAGLSILIALQLISAIWALIIPHIITGGAFSFATISAVYNISSSVATLGAVALLASAAVTGRSTAGYLDPSKPGAPPSTYAGYQGTGYPTTGQQPPEPGANPYT